MRNYFKGKVSDCCSPFFFGLATILTPAQAEPLIEVSPWKKEVISEDIGMGAADIFTGDVDGDGQDEFTIITVFPEMTYSLYDYEGGTWNRTILENGPLPADHELYDIDGDGDLDGLVAMMCSEGRVAPSNENCISSTMVWYENIDNGRKWEKHLIGNMQIMGANYVRAVDMDGDGDLDALTGTTWLPVEAKAGEVAWFRNNLNTGQPWEKIVVSAPGPEGIKDINMLDVADFDKDGLMDIAVTTSMGVEEVGSVYWFKALNKELSSWKRFQINPTNTLAAWSVFAIDINQDGYEDLAVGRNNSRVSNNPGGILFYINPQKPEDGTTWDQYAFDEGEYKMGPYFNFTDVDDDGALDIISTYTGEDSKFKKSGDSGNVSWIKFHFDQSKGIVQDQRIMIDPEQTKAWDVHVISGPDDGKNGIVVSDFHGSILFYEKPE